MILGIDQAPAVAGAYNFAHSYTRMYPHTKVEKPTYTYTHGYVCMYVPLYVRACKYMYIFIYSFIYIHVYIHCISVCICACMNVRTHACMCAFSYLYAHLQA